MNNLLLLFFISFFISNFIDASYQDIEELRKEVRKKGPNFAWHEYEIISSEGIIASFCNEKPVLLQAAEDNNYNVVRLLIEEGADINVFDKYHRCADDIAQSPEIKQLIRSVRKIWYNNKDANFNLNCFTVDEIEIFMLWILHQKKYRDSFTFVENHKDVLLYGCTPTVKSLAELVLYLKSNSFNPRGLNAIIFNRETQDREKKFYNQAKRNNFKHIGRLLIELAFTTHMLKNITDGEIKLAEDLACLIASFGTCTINKNNLTSLPKQWCTII